MHLQIQYFLWPFFLLFNLRYTFHKWTPLWPLKHKSCTTVSFHKQNRSDIQLRSKWNKHHLVSNPCIKTNLQTNATFFKHYTVFRGTITNYGFTFVLCCNSLGWGGGGVGGTSLWPFVVDQFLHHLQRLLITVVCHIMNLDICSVIKYLQLGQFRCGQLATVSKIKMTQRRHLVADNYNSALV